MKIRGRVYFLGLLLIFFTSFVLTACFDEEDYNFKKVSAIELSPSYAVKLLKGRLSITDLANDFEEVELRTYPDGLLYFYYETESESESISDIIQLPDVSLNALFNSPIDLSVFLDQELTVLETSFAVDLGITGGEIDSIFYTEFPIDFSVESSIEEIFDISLTFPTFTQDGEVITKTLFKEDSGNSDPQESDVFTEFIAALNTLDPAFNKFPVDLKLTLKENQYITITEDDYLSITLDIKNQGFIWVKGYFEPTSRMISDEDLSIDLFDTNFTDAEYDLEGARLTFEIDNEFGVPLKLDFHSLDAVNSDGGSLPIEIDPASPFTINSPTQVGENATSIISVVNPVEIFKFKPAGFIYAIEAFVNDGIATGRNFLAANSKINVKFSAEMPLWGNADGIALTDTFAIELNELSGDNIDIEPLNFTLNAKIENAYPVDVFVQLVLLDENYNYLDVLLTEEQTLLVNAAETNDTGIVKTGIFDDDIILSDEKTDKLFDAKHMILIANLRTFTEANGTRPNVKFFEQGFINTDIGIGTELKIEIKP